MSEIDQLIKMANQIAANFSVHEDVAERVADHMQRFWPPVMKKMLCDYAENNTEGLDLAVRRALSRLRINK